MFRESHRVPPIHAKPVDDGDTLHETKAVMACREWVFSRATLLILAGKVGTGKSLGAAWALWDRLTMTSPVNVHTGQKIPPDGRLWISAQDVANLNPQWSPDRVELEHLKAVPILVVDDVGEEDGSPAKVATLICSRCADGLRTIVTTNLDRGTFRERYGERLIDRLRQSGLDENGKSKWWRTCDGPSLRGVVEPKPVDRSDDDVVPEPEPPPISAEERAAMSAEFMQLVRSE
jgi:hypothetical protein